MKKIHISLMLGALVFMEANSALPPTKELSGFYEEDLVCPICMECEENHPGDSFYRLKTHLESLQKDKNSLTTHETKQVAQILNDLLSGERHAIKYKTIRDLFKAIIEAPNSSDASEKKNHTLRKNSLNELEQLSHRRHTLNIDKMKIAKLILSMWNPGYVRMGETPAALQCIFDSGSK